MLNPRISGYLFLIASISAIIATAVSAFTESSLDVVYLATGLFCGAVSIAMFRKDRQRKGIRLY